MKLPDKVTCPFCGKTLEGIESVLLAHMNERPRQKAEAAIQVVIDVAVEGGIMREIPQKR